jgi:YHS domain-containing protein
MFRAIVYAILGLLAISFFRGVLNIFTRSLSDAMNSGSNAGNAQPNQPQPADRANFGGDLVKDPVCGTFVSSKSSLSLTTGATAHCFCSQACLDQFRAQAKA